MGITNNLERRIREHKTDKLCELNADIYYFPVEYREDANLIETYLISANPSCHKFNESKTKKGNVSFLKNISFPFVPFTGNVDEQLEPFIIKQNITEVVIKTKCIDNRSIDAKTSDFWEGWEETDKYLNDEIENELEILVALCSMYKSKFGYSIENLIVSESDLLEGIILHQKRLNCLNTVRNDHHTFTHTPDETIQKHISDCIVVLTQIKAHEDKIACA